MINKIIQLEVKPDGKYESGGLYALDEFGDIWFRADRNWNAGWMKIDQKEMTESINRDNNERRSNES